MIFVLTLRMRCEGEMGTQFTGTPDLRPPESNIPSRNNKELKSELCILGIEKRLVYFQDAADLTAVNN